MPKPSKKHGLKDIPPPAVVDYDKETPKFCLRHAHHEHDVERLAANRRADFAVALQRRSRMTWAEIRKAPTHGLGSELIDANAIRPGVPPHFQDRTKFMALRYSGNLPVVGVRINDVFHVLWIEDAFGNVYDHD